MPAFHPGEDSISRTNGAARERSEIMFVGSQRHGRAAQSATRRERVVAALRALDAAQAFDDKAPLDGADLVSEGIDHHLWIGQ